MAALGVAAAPIRGSNTACYSSRKNRDQTARVLRPVTSSNVRGWLAFPQFLSRFLDIQGDSCRQHNL